MRNINIFAEGKRVILRDRIPSDVDNFIHWQTHGEWRHYDAPWETPWDTFTPEIEAKIREKFLASCSNNLPTPRKSLIIALREGDRPLGWVSSYGNERFPAVIYIGIDICEDHQLNHGLGTEALRLWVDYLFANSEYHKIECHTWSFNPRMMRVAEKLGFIHEGTERQIIQWQYEWQDRVRFGMLHREWKLITNGSE